MRWLIIVLLVSLGVLLFAAAGLVRHVWLQRRTLQAKTPAAIDPAEKTYPES
jgi:hypothetical protein